ncbi:ArsR/SmtB family transcription factor [Yinghuangia soli]|uniref:Helix-turn-helix domain-containing protein n=1 Tax=Yinghuangia soli TaxID=2908204 RepID=A0AA41PY80_9ACTN|nr:metalloregulator ArsR/SmtB family transcription factor [Yinghuangia soli]MCF2528109.1 helix-turn-helix domain-containing protein [Yinghuangia soli]
MTTNDPVLRALAHPTRLRMMSLMWAAPQSAAELGREVGVSQALASHHLRTLGAAGLVEQTGTRKKRGGVERLYRAVRGTPLSDRQDGDAAVMLAETLAHNLRERSRHRTPDEPGVTSDVELWLRPEVWDEFRERMAGLVLELHDASEAPRTEGTVRVGGTVLLYRMDDGDDQDGRSADSGKAGAADGQGVSGES